MEKSKAELVLDEYYPQERTVFREKILQAMEEYANIKVDDVKDESQKDLAVILKGVAKEKDEFEQRYIVANAKLAVQLDKAKKLIEQYRQLTK